MVRPRPPRTGRMLLYERFRACAVIALEGPGSQKYLLCRVCGVLLEGHRINNYIAHLRRSAPRSGGNAKTPCHGIGKDNFSYLHGAVLTSIEAEAAVSTSENLMTCANKVRAEVAVRSLAMHVATMSWRFGDPLRTAFRRCFSLFAASCPRRSRLLAANVRSRKANYC